MADAHLNLDLGLGSLRRGYPSPATIELRQSRAWSFHLDVYQLSASDRYPHIPTHQALYKYVEEEQIEWSFFLNREGQRCIWEMGKENVGCFRDVIYTDAPQRLMTMNITSPFQLENAGIPNKAVSLPTMIRNPDGAFEVHRPCPIKPSSKIAFHKKVNLVIQKSDKIAKSRL